MIVLNVSYNTDNDVFNVESSGGMKQLSELHNSYWMCEGWGLLPDWASEQGMKYHGHEVLKDTHWLIGMRLCKQSHMAEMTSFGEGIPHRSPC